MLGCMALEDRYTYTKGSASAGLIVYEDKFASSHHGTDPCGGKPVSYTHLHDPAIPRSKYIELLNTTIKNHQANESRN